LKISKIFLYDEPSVPELKISELAHFIKDTFRINAEARKNIFLKSPEQIAEKIASCRIFNTRKPFEIHKPTKEEIAFEIATLSDSKKNENIVMYDGFEFQKIVNDLVTPQESNLDQLHIVFTNKLMCTYDYNDYRFHGRAIICSNPTIISTTGIIEAPAKPREYYLELISKMAQGLNVESVKKKYQGTYLEYHDKRLSNIAEGYVMQGIFYYLTGEPFCDTLECRLNNPHWQKDLLYSQIQVGKLCDKHEKILNNL
jgi:hypothetical protein